MAEDMAMPDILPTVIDHIINGARPSAPVNKASGRTHQFSTFRHGWVNRAFAVKLVEGLYWKFRSKGRNGALERVNAISFLPTQFIGIGRQEQAIPANAIDQLSVGQMDVDRMCIHAIMRDLP